MNYKKKLQEDQYNFPYHHIPYLKENKEVVRHRTLNWGFKYFCYLLHIKHKVDSLDPESVLDVGCGDGRLLGILNNRIKSKVGVDLSEKSIMFARAFYPNILFYNKDTSEIEKKFDIVIAMGVLEHVPSEKVIFFLKSISEKVKKGGHVIISVPTLVQPLNDKHYRHYNIDIFKNELKNAQTSLQINQVEYIYKQSFWLKLYEKITFNKLWFLEVKFINRIAWQLIWKKLRIASKKNGHSMIITLKNA